MKNQPNKYDGLRSVERRILFTMSKLPSKKKFEKSLRVVGHIIGKYHPYGVEETYDALARMTRTFSYRYPLVNGQGSFGSIADPSYVDARFTEVRLSPIGRLMVENIELCKMVPNYDGFLVEPEFLESRFPNILANGAFNDDEFVSLSHNLHDIYNAVCAVLENPNIDDETLLKVLNGPDFPMGGSVVYDSELQKAYRGESAQITIQTRFVEETGDDWKRIVVVGISPLITMDVLYDELNAAKGKVPGFLGWYDQTEKNRARLIIDVALDFDVSEVFENLCKCTSLRKKIKVNQSDDSASFKELLRSWIKHRMDAIARKAELDKTKALDRLHRIEYFNKNKIGRILEIISAADTYKKMESDLKEAGLDEIQIDELYKIKMRDINGIKYEIEREYLQKVIAECDRILNEEKYREQLLIADLKDLAEKYGDERRTEICY